MGPRVDVTFDGQSRGMVTAARSAASGIAEVKREAGSARAPVQNLDRDIGKLSRGALAGSGIFRGLGRSVAFASAGFLGGYGLTAAVSGALGELEKAQKVGTQTNTVLKSTGGVAGVTAKQVDELAKSLLRKSGIDDEAIKTSENLLLTFTQVRNEVGKGNDIFNQATKAILDTSVALGQDLSSTAIQVGKALNDPLTGMTALRRVGVSFTQQQVEQVKAMLKTGDIMKAQKLILHELNVEFGGSAKAYGQSLPGAISRARESVRNLSADLLRGLAPSIREGADELQAWIEKEQASGDLQRKFNVVVKDGKEVVSGFVDVARTAIKVADDAAGAVGGWKNATELLVGLKAATWVSGWTKGLGGLIGASGASATGLAGAEAKATGLLGVLRRLGGLNAISIPIVLYITYRKQISSAVDKGVDAILGGLGADTTSGGPAPYITRNGKLLRWTGDRYVVVSDAGIPRQTVTPSPAGSAVGRLTGPTLQVPSAFTPTHQTGGLPGFPAVDIFKSPGTRVLAPEDGTLADPHFIEWDMVKRVGGWTLYFQGAETGNTYFMTHLAAVGKAGRYRKGDVIGTVAAVPGGAWQPHIHVGEHQGTYQVPGSGTGTGRYTPHDPNVVKPPPTTTKPSPTQLPGPIRLSLAQAGATAGLADDISANEKAVAFLTGKLRRTTKTGVKADLQDAINGYRSAIAEARKKLVGAATEARGRRTEERGVVGEFRTGLAGAEQAFRLDLLPLDQENRLKAQIAKFKALAARVEKDGKITPAELKRIQKSWADLGPGITGAATAAADYAKQVVEQKWSGVTSRIQRTIAEKWNLTSRDFGRETDRGLRAISASAAADLQQMSRDFSRQLAAFDRETQAGLAARGAPEQTPTEQLLAQRAESLQAQQQQEQLAADQAAGDAKAVARDLYDIETSQLEKAAQAERKAADEKARADQEAYQQSRDDLRQSLEDAEAVREQARQAEADAAAQAYQDQRDAQWQHLQDVHDDQVTAFNADLELWVQKYRDMQVSADEFFRWYRDASKVLTGGEYISPGDIPGQSVTTLLPADGFGRPHTITGGFQRGGKLPGRYIGREDTVVYRGTPGETVIDRRLTAALERMVASGGWGGGQGPTIERVYVLGADERQVGRALERLVTPAAEKAVRYRVGP
jgi:hypothetical protein